MDKWSYFYLDLVRANGKMQRGVELFHRMVKDSLAADRPYDDFARSLISSSGKSNYVVPAVNPIVREHVEGKTGLAPDNGDDFDKINQTDTHDEVSILFGKIFLGINLSCIGCHDGAGHLEKVNVYLSRKKRSDFFQQSSFFGNTRYIQWIDETEFRMGLITVDDLGKGYNTKEESMLRMRRTGGPNAAKFILTDEAGAARPGSAGRTGADADGASAVRARDRESVLVKADGRRFRGAVGRVRSRAAGSEKPAEGLGRAAFSSRAAGSDGGLFPQEQLQPAQAVFRDLQFQRLPAFGAIPRRMEGQLHEVLRAEIRPHARRRGIA